MPAPENTGRVFVVDGVEIPASAKYVVDSNRCTTLGLDGARLSTVEHLLAALAGSQIDNARILVEGIEMPILDGSSLPWVEAISSTGIVSQTAPARFLTLQSSITARSDNGSSWLQATPAQCYELSVETQFNDWAPGNVVHACNIDEPNTFSSELAMARTFAFFAEVAPLIAAGLAKGGSLDNVVIITPPDTFSSPLRAPHEWCRHKALDVVGDLALVNARLKCSISAFRPGHTMNTRMAQLLLAEGHMSAD
jgi:UDP-3-O-acyl N-acetylglucosamine deacetylase